MVMALRLTGTAGPDLRGPVLRVRVSPGNAGVSDEIGGEMSQRRHGKHDSRSWRRRLSGLVLGYAA